MANYERGSDDVRVFDGGEDEEDVEGSRLPLLIVIALIVLAAFGAVVWLAYQHGLAEGHSEIPRTIAAEPGPAKIAPTDSGGTPTPYTGLKIYQQHAPSEADASTDTTAPPSNDALKPQPPVATAPPAPTVPKPEAAPVQKPPPAVAMAPPPPVVAPPKPAPVAVKPPPPKPVVEQPVDVPVATPAPTPVAGGSALLQIGAYKSEAEANAAWTAYKAKHPSAAGLSSDVKQVDLGAKGTWFRLRIVTAKAGSAALCDKLKAEGGACIPSK